MKKIFLTLLMVLTLGMLAACDFTVGGQTDMTDEDIANILASIEVGYATDDNHNSVTQDVILPLVSAVNGAATIRWESNREDVLSVLDGIGVVTQTDEDVFVLLSVFVTLNNKTDSKEFVVKVIKYVDEPIIDLVDFDEIFARINISTSITSNITLPTLILGATITWKSSNSAVITNTGVVTQTSNDEAVTLTATATKDNQTDSFEFNVLVLKQSEMIVSQFDPIAEVRLKSTGTSVKIEGVVTSLMSNGNYTLQDSTGAIPVYFGSGKNSELIIGNHYVITGELGAFQGLIQIVSPKVENKGAFSFPSVLDLTGNSLSFDDVLVYEAHVVTYNNFEVTAVVSEGNAHELQLVNNSGEATMLRLDTRVNATNALSDVQVGQIINLTNVTIGQYKGEVQFLYNSRSSIQVFPKDPNKPMILGTSNHTYVIGESDEINFLTGVSASDSIGTNYNANLTVDFSKVNYMVVGDYEVTYKLSGITGYDDIIITVNVSVREIPEPGSYTGYYSGLDGLTGSSLNSALESLIKNTGSKKGNPVRTVDSWEGSTYLIYTGKGAYGNREHVVPNSRLKEAGSPSYDLHNLRAANSGVNSKRGNDPFIERPANNDGSWASVSGGFYPGDEHVGDVARIVLFMYLREPNLNRSKIASVDMLVRWHIADPVNDFELVRNDRIYGEQKNRNPFIDHPDLVEIYFGPAKPKAAKATLDNAIRLNQVVINSFNVFKDDKQIILYM